MGDWDGWPAGWPVDERPLVGEAKCRRCKEQLAGTVGRATPTGWMHRACAIEFAAEHEPRQLAEPQATAAGMVVCLSDELDSEE